MPYFFRPLKKMLSLRQLHQVDLSFWLALCFIFGNSELFAHLAQRIDLAIDNCPTVYCVILNKNYTTTNILFDSINKSNTAHSPLTHRTPFSSSTAYIATFSASSRILSIKCRISDNVLQHIRCLSSNFHHQGRKRVYRSVPGKRNVWTSSF